MDRKKQEEYERYLDRVISLNPQKVGDSWTLEMYSAKPVIIEPGEAFKFNKVRGSDYAIKHSLKYDGKNKTRIDAETYSKEFYGDIEYAISEFEQVCSIDTNSEIIGGIKTHICVFIRWDIIGNSLVPSWVCVKAVPDKDDCLKKPENYMWSELITSSINDGHIDKDKKIAIVVDSDKDNLIDYNSGKQFIEEKDCDCCIVTLPTNFKFIYASSDKGNSVYNKIFKLNEHIAKQMIKAIKAEIGICNEADEDKIVAAFNKRSSDIKNIFDNYFNNRKQNKGVS